MRDTKGRFKKGHKTLPGAEKGWFKKGHPLGKRFERGHEPWNKGTHIQTNTGKTHFTAERVKGVANNKWKGGRKKNSYGYIHILNPTHPFASKTGYVLEHRLIVEKDLGRYLQQGEVVHHLNYVRDDNRLENLELLASHSEHMKNHHKHITNYPGGKPHIR